MFAALAIAAVGGTAALATTWLRIARAGRVREPEVSDLIAVFGAAVIAGRPCLELEHRLAHAFDLYRQEKAPVIACLGGYSDSTSEVDVMRSELERLGLPSAAIRAFEPATSTRRAVELLRRDAPGARVLAVSSPYHMLRILSECRRWGVAAIACPPPVRSVTASSRVRIVQTAREVVALWWYALAPKAR